MVPPTRVRGRLLIHDSVLLYAAFVLHIVLLGSLVVVRDCNDESFWVDAVEKRNVSRRNTKSEIFTFIFMYPTSNTTNHN